MKDLISVIIPVYNVENYLRECLNSVIGQTYCNLDIILVDDGSTDMSGNICDEYGAKFGNIKVIHKENKGLSSARNVGLKFAKGRYVCFVDSDDYLATDAIELLYTTIGSCGISTCKSFNSEKKATVGFNSEIKVYSSEEFIKRILTEEQDTSAWGKLFEVSLFDDIEFPEGKIYEDYATILKLADKVQSVACSGARKYYYRYNPESITKSKFSKKKMDYFEISDDIKKYISEKHSGLTKYVKNRETRYAISFFKECAKTNYWDDADIKVLIDKTRENLIEYLFSKYKITSKLYGICIAVFPKIAYKIFNRR